MRVRNRKTGKWVELPDGPTEEEEAAMSLYKQKNAEPWMRWYDASAVVVKKRWQETGQPV